MALGVHGSISLQLQRMSSNDTNDENTDAMVTFFSKNELVTGAELESNPQC